MRRSMARRFIPDSSINHNSTMRKHRRQCQGFGVGLLAGFGALLAAGAESVDVSKLPPPSAAKIDFDRDIRPILEKSCLRCHGPEKPKGDYRLDRADLALKAGEHGPAILPMKSEQSRLIHFVARLVPDMEMPPDGKAEPLTAVQVGLLRAWIDQGAEWGASSSVDPYRFDYTTLFGATSVQGNEAKFREHFWMPQGVHGGIERFHFSQRQKDDSTFTASGRILRDDYRVSLALEKPKLGSVRFGWEQSRKYFSDLGGYHPGLAVQTPGLGRELFLDGGRTWFDVTLNRPDWPVITLGYEYQYRDGEKSMLNWGNTEDPTTTGRSVYPAYKGIREAVHVLKFDLDYSLGDWRFQDQFRGEFYDLRTEAHRLQYDTTFLTLTANQDSREGTRHFQGANAFRIERPIRSWLFGSAGYLFSRLEGESSLGLSGTYYGDAGSPIAGTIVAHDIILDRQTHMGNLNLLVGPWEGFSVSAGAQTDWTHQRGFGAPVLNIPLLAITDGIDAVSANSDRKSVEETLMARYTKIPGTVLFGDVRLRQETADVSQELNDLSIFSFSRESHIGSELRDWRAGFNNSSLSRVTFGGHFRQREYADHYGTRRDEWLGVPTAGDPAFIRERETFTDEVQGQMTARLASWFRSTFTYKWSGVDYWTVTDEETTGPGSPGGGHYSGKQMAQSFSVGGAITPWRRLRLNENFTYRHTRTTTAQNDIASVVPFQGDLYSVISGATYMLTPSTDLTANYTWSRADYGQDQFAGGLPLGLDYELHGLQTGVSWKFRKRFTTRVQYGFYQYDEKNSGGYNNYTAHAVFMTVNVKMP